ncbi:MAG: BatD family protein, partial [Bacteroidales bacterium]|nr:BatD family protein [Bacteroidales bacterium]
MKILKYIFLFIAVSSAVGITADAVYAQEPQLTASAPKQVYEGDNFQISFSFNARGASNLQVPPFKGFDVSGPFQSQSSNSSYINGKVSHSFTISYTYQLRALKAGTYNIGAASITADGNKYSSDPFTIQVIASANRPAASQTQQSQGQMQQPQAATSANISDNDLYIRVTANKSNPYKGEEVILTYKLYYSVALSSISLEKMPSFKGFWSEEFGGVDERKQETINGKRYIVSTFRKVSVFPQEVGALSLEPLELKAIAQVATPRKRTGSIWDIFDDPFFTPYQNVEKKIKSNTLTLRVKDLPENDNFSGTVGDFNTTFDYDATKQLVSGEAITFKFTVTGHGNIEMITPPEIVFPPDFEVYEPQINSDKSATVAGVSGSMTFEYTVIPRSAGRFVIPSFDYTIFNPSKQKYETTTIPEISLDVAQGKETVSIYSNRQIKGDIEYIKTNTPKFKITGYRFFLSLDFFILIAVVILLFAAAVITFKNNVKKQLDVVGIRNRKALREAKKCLKKASKFMTSDRLDEFYT